MPPPIPAPGPKRPPPPAMPPAPALAATVFEFIRLGADAAALLSVPLFPRRPPPAGREAPPNRDAEMFDVPPV